MVRQPVNRTGRWARAAAWSKTHFLFAASAALRLRAATHDAYIDIDTDDAVHPFLRPSERALSGE